MKAGEVSEEVGGCVDAIASAWCVCAGPAVGPCTGRCL